MEREDDAAATPASPIESETKPPRVESDEKETRNDPNQTPRSESQMSQTSQTSLQQLTDRALHFLSTASNETIGACLVGLGAGTYLVLGRVGLVLIGVVGGVVLHATWEGGSGATGDASKAVEERRRKEVGLDVIHRVLNWRSHKKEDEGDSALLKVDAITLKEEDLKFMKFKPETAEALRQITDAVIRDYVKSVP